MTVESPPPVRKLKLRTEAAEKDSHVGEQIGRIRMSEATRRTRPEKPPRERSVRNTHSRPGVMILFF